MRCMGLGAPGTFLVLLSSLLAAKEWGRVWGKGVEGVWEGRSGVGAYRPLSLPLGPPGASIRECSASLFAYFLCIGAWVSRGLLFAEAVWFSFYRKRHGFKACRHLLCTVASVFSGAMEKPVQMPA